jgi:MarR family transcriptional regulator, temperature-dependent positive regulator of motility
MFEHCLYFNTTALARRLEREWTLAFQPLGLTPPQAFMLRAVIAAPGSLQSELAEAMAIARPTATRALDALESKGMITRQLMSHDNRLVAIHPTKAALSIATDLNQASPAVTRKLKSKLSDTVFQDAVAQVRSVRSVLE